LKWSACVRTTTATDPFIPQTNWSTLTKTTCIYLIHFDAPFGHARHYLGSTTALKARLDHHRTGHGSRLMHAVTRAGIGWRVVRTWPGGKQRERQMKMQGAGKHCPICHEKPRGTRAKDYT
jgi:hypothetical protein